MDITLREFIKGYARPNDMRIKLYSLSKNADFNPIFEGNQKELSQEQLDCRIESWSAWYDGKVKDITFEIEVAIDSDD